MRFSPSVSGANGNLTTKIDEALCNACIEATRDILTGGFNVSQRWATLESKYNRLTYLRVHLPGGTLSTLLRSRNNTRCKLCALFFDQLVTGRGVPSATPYWIVVKPASPKKHEFFLCLGDLEVLVQHRGTWTGRDPTRPLSFFLADDEHAPATFSGFHANIPFAISDFVPPKLPQIDLGSVECLDQAIRWVGECHTHPECQRSPSLFPRRLVNIDSSNPGGLLYLCEFDNGETGDYATVSYSWGDEGFRRFKTDQKKIAKRRRGFHFEKLPLTLRDAVSVARRLGLRFLWIDSLCIIQDDTSDWDEQSQEMTRIYGGALVNIAATSGENSESGLFSLTRRHGTRVGSVVAKSGSSDTLSSCLRVGPRLGSLDLDDKFASTRGWIFQERLVSRATLHFTDEGLVWECCKGTKTAHDQAIGGHVSWKKQWNDVARDFSDGTQASGAVRRQEIAERCLAWRKWVAAYAERNLYREKDRFPAIAGSAKTLKSILGMRYMAGLWVGDPAQDLRWSGDLLQGLLWKRYSTTVALDRSKSKATPTWSWASVRGRLEFPEKVLRPTRGVLNTEVLDEPNVEEKRPGTFGRVYHGSLWVRGLLQQITVDRSLHPGTRQKWFQACGASSGIVHPYRFLITLDDPSIKLKNFSCSCLRIGTFHSGGKSREYFLLLQGADDFKYHILPCFRRIGFAETDPWEEPTTEEGALMSPVLQEVVLV